MDKQVIKSEVKDIILTFVNTEDENNYINIDENAILNDGEYGLDSLSLINIVVEIERRFGIQIDDEYLDMEFLSSINSMTDFVWEIINKSKEN